jgi:glycine hydroxymethyltransferase
MDDEILHLIEKHEAYRSKCVNLVASENVVSSNVRKALGSDLTSRYVARPKFYGGTEFMEEIWNISEKRAAKVFHSKFASVNPVGGHLALMATLAALCKRGSLVMSPPPTYGGYPGLAQDHSAASLLGLKMMHLPFDEANFNIDVSNSLQIIKKDKPDLVVLGASILLFPHPVRQLAEFVHEYGGKLVFDGSHVMGLIAGGKFQDPLNEGADVLFGSTHKSFFGPQGGLVLSNNEEIMNKITSNFVHVTQDNPHPNRIAGLAVALGEAEKHAADYAKQIVRNSQTMANLLAQKGFPVVKNTRGEHTFSHQVFLKYSPEKGVDFRDKLEGSDIIVDSEVRLGTSEVTRRGYVEQDVEQVVDAIEFCVNGSPEQSKKLVTQLVSKHQSLVFC